MSDVLKNPIFCAHDSGEVVFTGTEGPLCGDCHAPMAWIAVSYIEAYSTVIDHQGAEIARLRERLSEVTASQARYRDKVRFLESELERTNRT